MSDWKTLIGNQILEHAPFLVGATGGGVNTTRIVEAVLIAGATAMLTSAITTDKVAARLEERIVAVQARLDRCENLADANIVAHAEMRERIASCEIMRPPQ